MKIDTKKDSLTEREKELVNFAQNKEWGQTYFKAKHFVGNSQIHPYAIYRQFLMELRSREDIVRKFEYDLKSWEIELEIKKVEAEEAQGLAKKRLELEVIKSEHDLVMHRQRVQDGYRERKQYLDLLKEFEESPANTLPDGRKISENINDIEFEKEMEHHYWTYRMAKQVGLDMIAYGRPTTGNMDSITMMSPKQQNEVLAIASDFVVRNEARSNLLMQKATEKFNLGYKPDELSEATGVLTDINTYKMLESQDKK